jgi:hypothetical protein
MFIFSQTSSKNAVKALFSLGTSCTTCSLTNQRESGTSKDFFQAWLFVCTMIGFEDDSQPLNPDLFHLKSENSKISSMQENLPPGVPMPVLKVILMGAAALAKRHSLQLSSAVLPTGEMSLDEGYPVESRQISACEKHPG